MASDQLNQIVALASTLRDQKQEVERLEQELKEAKAAALRSEREDLPALMMEAGLTELRLQTGELVKLTEDCDARITDATRDRAIRWLDDNGFGGLVKTKVMVEFDRQDREIAAEYYERLRSSELPGRPSMDASVHHSTLRSWVKEQLAEGASIPMDLFNVNPFNKVVIKKK